MVLAASRALKVLAVLTPLVLGLAALMAALRAP